MKLRKQRCPILMILFLLITGAPIVFPQTSRPNAEHDKIAIITKFLAARASGNYDLARSFLAPDARIWFGKKEGEGGQWTVPGRWTNWDRYFNGKVTYSDWKVSAESVTANGIEINDFYRLIDRPAQPLKATWWFDKKERMTGFLFEPVKTRDLDKDKLADFEKWARRNNPEELKYLMPDGQIDPTGDRPARWRTILVAWRNAAGLRTIEI